MDVSTAPSGGGESRSGRGYQATDSYSFNHSDEDFLVVDCRNTSPDTSTQPSGVHKSDSGQSASQTANADNATSNGCNVTCSITESASGT